MRHDEEIQLNNPVSLLFSMFCSHDQAFKNIRESSCICERKMLSSTCNELTIISYIGKCEYDYCFNILQEHNNNILKEC